MFNTNEEALEAIMKACEHLGWAVAVPSENPDDDIKGLVIGDPDYIDSVLNGDYADDSKV
jgi:hypothetical protein